SAGSVSRVQLLLRADLRTQSDAACARSRDPRGGWPARRVSGGHSWRRRTAAGRRRRPPQSRRFAARRSHRHPGETRSRTLSSPAQWRRPRSHTVRLGLQGAHDELLALGERLKAPMVHTMRGKEHVEWENPYDVGMTGLIGFSSGYYTMLD